MQRRFVVMAAGNEENHSSKQHAGSDDRSTPNQDIERKVQRGQPAHFAGHTVIDRSVLWK